MTRHTRPTVLARTYVPEQSVSSCGSIKLLKLEPLLPMLTTITLVMQSRKLERGKGADDTATDAHDHHNAGGGSSTFPVPSRSGEHGVWGASMVCSQRCTATLSTASGVAPCAMLLLLLPVLLNCSAPLGLDNLNRHRCAGLHRLPAPGEGAAVDSAAGAAASDTNCSNAGVPNPETWRWLANALCVVLSEKSGKSPSRSGGGLTKPLPSSRRGARLCCVG
ncbi:hypothetical protein COO60DRAFT_1481128 [Scenedesmus sp. NREL 46B-D3]|nr:hypothetical protein COO60DRAFT_1481128 [Scenedesmus sp. NREL 46B-D3]